MRKILSLLIVGALLTGCATSSNEDHQVSGKMGGTAVVLKADEKHQDKKEDSSTEKKEGNDTDEKEKVSDTKVEKKRSESSSGKSDSSTSTSKTETQTSNSSTGNSSSKKEEQAKPNTDSTASGTNQPSEPCEPSKPVETPPVVEEPTPEPPVNQQEMADQIFAQINAYRVENGKEPFTYSAELRSRCDSHSLAMAQREALWHSGDGAECITNYEDPFSAWVSSPPHQKLLLSNNTEAAVGIYYYKGYYYSVFQTRW